VDVHAGRRRPARGLAPFAHATAAGDTLYVTGQMPTGLDGALVGKSIGEQTDQVMRNLSRVLELVGSSLDDVVMTRAYLVDWDEYAAFNTAYERWFPARLPSRTCVGTPGLAAGARASRSTSSPGARAAGQPSSRAVSAGQSTGSWPGITG